MIPNSSTLYVGRQFTMVPQSLTNKGGSGG